MAENIGENNSDKLRQGIDKKGAERQDGPLVGVVGDPPVGRETPTSDKRLQEALALLADVEWILGDEEDGCPSCYSSREEGHHPACDLNRVLRGTP